MLFIASSNNLSVNFIGQRFRNSAQGSAGNNRQTTEDLPERG
jgi:hypothetical protein